MSTNNRPMIIYAKLDAGFFSNRKVVRAGRDGRDVYLFVLCENQKRGAIGRLPLADIEPWFLARQLLCTEAEAANGVRMAILAGLIEVVDDHVVIVGWDRDWSRRALTGAERQSRYRHQNGSESDDGDGQRNSVTESVTRNADTVTKGKSGVTSDGATVTNVTSDESDGSSRSSKQASRESKRVTAKAKPSASRLSLDFAPGPEAVEICTERNLDVNHELAQFRDWAASDAKTSTDWQAAFRKFARSSKDIGHETETVITAKPATSSRVTRERCVVHPGQYLEFVDGEFVRTVKPGPGNPHAKSSGDWVEVESVQLAGPAEASL